jgi:hypothetical protein
MTLVDEVPVAEVERMIANGMATDIINNNITPSPPKNEQRQGELIGNEHALFILLEMIAIVC